MGAVLPEDLGIIPSQPYVGVADVCSRLVVLNHVGGAFTAAEHDHFQQRLAIGVYQRGALMVTMFDGNIGGDGIAVPCGGDECTALLAPGTHLTWKLVLARKGVVQGLRAASTDARFSKVWHRANADAAKAMAVTGDVPVAEAMAFQRNYPSAKAMWQAADGRSRFGQ